MVHVRFCGLRYALVILWYCWSVHHVIIAISSAAQAANKTKLRRADRDKLPSSPDVSWLYAESTAQTG